jgi:hypothetical protein
LGKLDTYGSLQEANLPALHISFCRGGEENRCHQRAAVCIGLAIDPRESTAIPMWHELASIRERGLWSPPGTHQKKATSGDSGGAIHGLRATWRHERNVSPTWRIVARKAMRSSGWYSVRLNVRLLRWGMVRPAKG